MKDTVIKIKSQVTDWENVFSKDIFDKGLGSNICKEILKLNNKKTATQLKMAKRAVQSPHQEIRTDGKRKHEKVLHIIWC